MMNSLDMFQSLVDNGSISPNSLNMNSAEQLNNFNIWLAQLTESIDTDQSTNNSNATPPTATTTTTSFDYVQPNTAPPPPMNYSDVLLQFNATNLPVNTGSSELYPTNVEDDMYVRSHPLVHPQPQQSNINFSAPGKLYGDFNMPPMMDNLNQYGYPANVSEIVPQMTGMRHHYTNVPGIASNGGFFTPDLRSAQNLGSSKDNVKYKKNPVCGQEKEEKAAEAFKPIKPSYHESKKNVTTMMNVFASSVDSGKKPTTSPVKETKQSPAKKSTKDILDLLVSDMSDLSIEKKQEEVKDDSKSLYPSSPSTEANDTASLPTSSIKISDTEKHRKLLKQLSQWVNQNYKERTNNAENIPSSTSPSVQVQ